MIDQHVGLLLEGGVGIAIIAAVSYAIVRLF